MPHPTLFLRLAALAALALLPVHGRADDWGRVATISATMGVHAGRLCYGEATRKDLGCPTDAPFISGSAISGTFMGDGSALTGVTATATDRITSGTTSLLAVSTTGFVSLTQAGTNTGWFDPARGLVTLGVSATGPVSATGGYFSGRVGVGTATPTAPLEISGSLHINANSVLKITGPGGITTGAIAIGAGASATPGTYAARIAIGPSAAAGNDGAIAIGGGATATTGNDAVAIGVSTNAGSKGIAIGGYSNAGNQEFVAGSSNASSQINNVYFGSGKTSLNPSNYTINGSGASGSNVAGADLYLAGGRNTGSGTPGSIHLQTASIGPSSTSQQALVNRLSIIGNSGRVGIGTITPTAQLDVSGTLRLAGTGADGCAPGQEGTLKVVSNTLWLCRQTP